MKCINQTWPISAEMEVSRNATWGTWKALQDGCYALPAFEIDLWDLVYKEREGFQLRVGRLFIRNSPQNSEYVVTNCYFSPAIVEYDVAIVGETLTIQSGLGKFVRLVNNTLIPEHQVHKAGGFERPATITALLFDLQLMYQTNVSVQAPATGPNDQNLGGNPEGPVKQTNAGWRLGFAEAGSVAKPMKGATFPI